MVCTSLAAAAVAFGVGVSLSGQGQPASPGAPTPRNWYSVSVVTLKPDMVAEWTEFQKSQTMPMLQKAGVTRRDVWQAGAPFGEGFTYGIVTPVAKFADYDLPPLLVRTLGADAARAYNEKLRRMIASQRTYAAQDRAELSIMPAANAKVMGAILSDVTIVGGHAPQYEAYIKDDLLPVLKRGNVLGYAVSRTVFGGDANEYHIVQYFDSHAEIDKGPIPTRVLGAAAAQALTAKATPHVARVERTIIRFVPDLSIRPRGAS
jgi:hypothetical protein